MADDLEGGCVCGAVRYRIAGEPLAYYACHCLNCQKQSGSAFALSMVVRVDQLEVERGAPATFECRLPGGIESRGALCAVCVTRLWHESSAYPQIRSLRGGTLDDPRRHLPYGDVWTRSAQPWVAFTAGPRFDTQPEDPLVLVRAWRDRPTRGSGAP